MHTAKGDRTFFYILLGAVSLAVLFIFFKYIPIILISAAFAVALHPIFRTIHSKVGRRGWLASLITIIFFLLIIGGLLFFVGARIFTEASSLYQHVLNNGVHSTYVDTLNLKIQAAFPNVPTLSLAGKVGDILSFVAGAASVVFASTLQTLFSFVLMLLSLFYFLKDGESFKKYIVGLSPLSDAHDERILTMLGRAVNGVMLGFVFVALIQGILLGIGLFIFGVPNAALLGLLAAIASMIPTIGTAFVSVPAILFLFATGHNAEAVGLLAWAALLVGTIDNLLSPVLVGKRIELSPILMLFSVLGAVSLLGASGVIIGPLTVSVLHTLIKIYKEDFS
jgi:predicted PurR-regulated permease PerM